MCLAPGHPFYYFHSSFRTLVKRQALLAGVRLTIRDPGPQTRPLMQPLEAKLRKISLKIHPLPLDPSLRWDDNIVDNANFPE